MWTAFPPSDYYRASVAMRPPREGLEPFRRSRLPHHATYRDRVRSPTHPLNRVHLTDRCTGRSCRTIGRLGSTPDAHRLRTDVPAGPFMTLPVGARHAVAWLVPASRDF